MTLTIRELENLGINLQDNICVFCSRTMDRQDKWCKSCNEYKSVMNIVSAIGYYGVGILGD
jgi:hypothetical protein